MLPPGFHVRGTPMTVLKLFFSMQGRINRATWWLLTMSIVILNAILAKILSPFFPPIHLGGLYGHTVSYADTIPSVVTFYPVLAIGAKRLHDRNKSGWWLALYAAPAALLILAAALFVAAPHSAADFVGPVIVLFFVTLLMIVWNFVELGFLKGDANANDHGHPWKMSDLLDGNDDVAPSGAAAWNETTLTATSALSTPAAKQNAAVAAPVRVRVGKPQGFGRRPVPSR
jgi:uncharacterized membrane protein YhaH (DUF805 family)